VARVGKRGSCATWRGEDPQLVADDLARLQELLGEQLTLW
jgi:hypothetical protein